MDRYPLTLIDRLTLLVLKHVVNCRARSAHVPPGTRQILVWLDGWRRGA